MPTSIDKFRKLLAAYEDEVQRKQHKMGKRVDPTDEVQPNWINGYCSFLRGQTVVWNPSFEVIGSYVPSSHIWTWGFADPGLDWRLRTRIEEVRTQGAAWGIDPMVSDALTLVDEQQAWELATVAAAVTRADGITRLDQGDVVRFLALFDGPPASRSSISMRALRESQMGMPAISSPASGPISSSNRPPSSQSSPALRRIATPAPASASPALLRRNTPMPASTPPPLGFVGGTLPAGAQAPSSLRDPNEREPTLASRNEIGQRLYEAVPYMHQAQVGTVSLLVRAAAPAGPVGAVSLEFKMVLKPANGGHDILLAPTAPLHDALVALWNRCRDRGAGYRFLTARVENGPNGLTSNVQLEW